MLNVLGQHVEAAETYVTENPSAHSTYMVNQKQSTTAKWDMTLFSDVPDEAEEFGKGIDFQICMILGLGVIDHLIYAFQAGHQGNTY